MKPPNTDIRVSFGFALKPGDADMSAGSSEALGEKPVVS
jgi:hypothetical protein